MHAAPRTATRPAIDDVPAWASCFLRERCAELQAQLLDAVDPLTAAVQEEHGIHRWTLLLVASADAPAELRDALERLHLLHARVAARVDRGGVADIAPEVDAMVRDLLVEELQRRTDEVTDRLG